MHRVGMVFWVSVKAYVVNVMNGFRVMRDVSYVGFV